MEPFFLGFSKKLFPILLLLSVVAGLAGESKMQIEMSPNVVASLKNEVGLVDFIQSYVDVCLYEKNFEKLLSFYRKQETPEQRKNLEKIIKFQLQIIEEQKVESVNLVSVKELVRGEDSHYERIFEIHLFVKLSDSKVPITLTALENKDSSWSLKEKLNLKE